MTFLANPGLDGTNVPSLLYIHNTLHSLKRFNTSTSPCFIIKFGIWIYMCGVMNSKSYYSWDKSHNFLQHCFI